MTTGLPEDRLDRLERIVISLAETVQANTQQIAESNRAIESLTVFAQAVFLRLDQMETQIATQGNYITTLQGQTQDTINQVRDLQVLGNRMMERLERLDGE